MITRVVSLALLFALGPASLSTPTLALPLQTGQSASALDCGCELDASRPLALVDGTPIPASALEADLAQIRQFLASDLDRLRAQTLDGLVTDCLVDAEAGQRGLSRVELIQTAVLAAVKPPNEVEVRGYYDANYADEQGPLASHRDEIVRTLLERKREAAYTDFVAKLRAAARIEILEAMPKAPGVGSDRARVVARVNGRPVTLGDVEDRLAPATYEARRKLYVAERNALGARVDALLVERAAAKAGQEPNAFADAEVSRIAHRVDEPEVREFYESQGGERSNPPFETVKAGLIERLQRVVNRRAFEAFMSTLRSNAKVEVYLVEPAPPAYSVDAPDRPSIGDASAAVTVVEFSDFECPRCAAARETVKALVEHYRGRVRFVARNFPLPQHVNAFLAAEAAEAARAQGKYWEFAEMLYANHDSLGEASLKALAAKAGLDRAKFDDALATHRYHDTVAKDVEAGNRIGIIGTPAFFVNGRAIDDISEASLMSAVEAALKSGPSAAPAK
jgi:protein-disulfide isomerase